MLLCAIALPASAEAAKGGSVRPGPTACQTNDCRERAYWKREYEHLPAADRRWLWNTGECETGGLRHPYAANTGNGYWGRYQFSPPTAGAAGFRIRAYRTYRHEQDVRAIWWKRRAGASQWPVCGY